MEMLKTPIQIRRQLGEDYSYIRRMFDWHKEDRARTKKIAEAAYDKAEECAICGQKLDVEGLKREWAHVIGPQECGETEPANLLPLCWRSDRKGCHQLYDGAPSATPAEVFEARKRWRKGNFSPELRQEMEARSRHFFRQTRQPPDSDREALARLIAASWFKKARELCRSKLKEALDESDHFWWQTKLVEVCRRSGGLVQLEAAERQWTKLEQIGPPPQLASSFFYEGGYIRLLLGQHEEAHQLFHQSVNTLQRTNPHRRALGQFGWPHRADAGRDPRKRCPLGSGDGLRQPGS